MVRSLTCPRVLPPSSPLCGTPAQDLRNVEHMYQFSLTSFIALFSRTLRKPMDAKSIDARISALVRQLHLNLNVL